MSSNKKSSSFAQTYLRLHKIIGNNNTQINSTVEERRKRIYEDLDKAKQINAEIEYIAKKAL